MCAFRSRSPKSLGVFKDYSNEGFRKIRYNHLLKQYLHYYTNKSIVYVTDTKMLLYHGIAIVQECINTHLEE